ncbi:Sporulation control protein Spo0M [[Actinomadura] parvosata subsp. kistnae]|uniref:Sporulation protein n=2 Tax=Nonomuraea TaxID=83681 RepID=A0A1V0A3E4_9ACTN|nr:MULTISPECIES: sporulation protein [unclassified Nonomuraea]AQZ64724.1 sporulation protein [Nonomuraea sp. ATCC 55076]NJP87864.1 sporulation protein [Nonomuraea sp. FMUSA5-5]SPL98532.1 Sporulation control protein Spo0M [Actinomadura parvosata subsp. kistnae]
MVFRKLMAAFGAGVEVDTVLTDTGVRPGEPLRGVVHFRGGNSDYKVEGIHIDLTAVVEVESGDNEYKTSYSFLRQQVAGTFQLAAGAQHQQPFEITIPWETPISAIAGHPLHGMKLGVQTELALAGALDKGDLDPLFVSPLPAQEYVIAALDRLGFQFKKADLERGTLYGSTMPFFQEIEYYAGGQWRRHFNELELTFIAGPRQMDVILEADKRGGFLTSSHDAYNRFTVRYDQPPHEADVALQRGLEQMARHRGWF